MAALVCRQESVAGVVLLVCKEAVQHHGITLNMEGLVNLQLSSKSVGVFEAFYNSVKVEISRTKDTGFFTQIFLFIYLFRSKPPQVSQEKLIK